MYCSMGVLNKNIRSRMEKSDDTILEPDFSYGELKAAIAKKDTLAVEEYLKVCEFLGIGIVNIINQINPGSIIIGDLLAELDKEIFINTVQKTVQQRVRKSIWETLRMETSTIGEDAILVGAGLIAVERICEDPFAFVKKNRE